MIHLKKYSHANPLIDLEFKVVLQQPWEGGTDQWVLEIIGDWDLPYRIYQPGDSKRWHIRDEVATRFMFETGLTLIERSFIIGT